MGTEARRLLDEALALSLVERAELAVELMASLDGEPDADAEAAWKEEIRQRAARARNGQTVGTTASAVHAKARAIVERR